MREFAQDPEARVHPQTVIEHFGTWNAAKRAAGLFPRRFLTREELLEQLRALGDELGRTPTARDLAARRRSLPSASLYAHTFGSLGERAPRGRVRGAPGRGAPRAGGRAGRGARRHASAACRRWPTGRRRDARIRALLSEWQVYRLLDVPRGAWTAFQYLVRERLLEDGVDVCPTARSGADEAVHSGRGQHVVSCGARSLRARASARPAGPQWRTCLRAATTSACPRRSAPHAARHAGVEPGLYLAARVDVAESGTSARSPGSTRCWPWGPASTRHRADALGLKARASWLRGSWRDALASSEAAVHALDGEPESPELARDRRGSRRGERPDEPVNGSHAGGRTGPARAGRDRGARVVRGCVRRDRTRRRELPVAAWLYEPLDRVEEAVAEAAQRVSRGLATESYALYLSLSLGTLVYVPAGRWDEAARLEGSGALPRARRTGSSGSGS